MPVQKNTLTLVTKMNKRAGVYNTRLVNTETGISFLVGDGATEKACVANAQKSMDKIQQLAGGLAITAASK